MTDREKLVELMCADNMIANGVTVQKWISVEDGLPEYGVDVLVCDRHSNVFVSAVCNSEYFSNGLTWRDQTGYMLGSLGITHWMPLPEPLKEE